jgi:hypothetical protein
MNRLRLAVLYVLMATVLGVVWIPTFAQVPAITPQEAHAIAVNAYVCFYPLVTMDLTRKQSTNIEPGKEVGRGPMNMFVNVVQYPPVTTCSCAFTPHTWRFSLAGGIHRA